MSSRTRRLLIALSVVLAQASLYAGHESSLPHRITKPLARIVWSFAPQGTLACEYILTPTSVSAPSTGSSALSASVVTGTNCSWTAVSNDAWITVTAGATGSSIGVVSYSVAANPTTSPRVGTLTIAGLTLAVTQAAAPVPQLSAPRNLRIIK